MRGLNYNHLYYFWVSARRGSLTSAAASLHLTPQTLSGQIRRLEERLGQPLFRRVGRRLALTEAGELVQRHADAIFERAEEMQRALAEGKGDALQPRRFAVGIADVVPKLLAHRMLAPVLDSEPPLRLTCLESTLEALLGDLVAQRIDLLIADRPLASTSGVRAYSQLLGECGVSFFAAPALTSELPFPELLDGAPMLLPTVGTRLRQGLDTWLEGLALQPRVVGEFDDSALLKAFGEEGAGVFASPSAVEADICQRYGVRVLGRTEEITERFFAIGAERGFEAPAAQSILRTARALLVGGVQDAAAS